MPSPMPEYLNVHYICESASRLLFLSMHWARSIPAFLALGWDFSCRVSLYTLYACYLSQEEYVISLSLCVCVGRSVTRLWYEHAGMSCLFWVWRSALRSWACPPFLRPSSIICSPVSRTVRFPETSSLTSEWTLCWRLEIIYIKQF